MQIITDVVHETTNYGLVLGLRTSGHNITCWSRMAVCSWLHGFTPHFGTCTDYFVCELHSRWIQVERGSRMLPGKSWGV